MLFDLEAWCGMRTEKIVIVDNDPQMIQLTTAALMEAGFRNIEQYHTAESLLENIEKETPIDLLITDEHMGAWAMPGTELIANLRKYETSGMKVLLVSGSSLPGSSDYSGEFLEKRLGFDEIMTDLREYALRLLG